MEIERKFLIEEVPDEVPAGPWRSLRQGYLAADARGEVRLRDADGARTLTAKSGIGIVREEAEIALTREQFEALWPLTLERRIEKRRAVVMLGAARIEIDVFEGPLAGLVVAEVEFETLEEALAFGAPAWFGAEVTDDVRYTNASLAFQGAPPREGDGAR